MQNLTEITLKLLLHQIKNANLLLRQNCKIYLYSSLMLYNDT